MKTKLILTLALLPCLFTTPVHAIFGVGDVVYDPSQHITNIMNHVETIAQWAEEAIKWEQQIQNTIEQIEKAKQTVTNTKTLVKQVGDWQQVYDRYQNILMRSERLTEGWGVSFDATLDYGQSGYYSYVKDSTAKQIMQMTLPITIMGNTLKIDPETKREAETIMQQKTTLAMSLAQNETDIKEILEQISRLSEDINAASTQSEVEKKQALLFAANAKLTTLRDARNDIMGKMKSLDVRVDKSNEQIKTELAAQNNAELLANTVNQRFQMTRVPR
jgi:predicted  nucleic acid-binding Zn-ribbon protein